VQCSATCQNEDRGGGSDSGSDGEADGGCCNVGGSPEGATALALLMLGCGLRRRRRARWDLGDNGARARRRY